MMQGNRVSVNCVHARSANWTGDRLAHLVNRPLQNPVLQVIEQRRQDLANLPPLQLHASYAGINENAGKEFVTPRTISLPRRYGRILYSVSVDLRPHLTLEAGSGLGISTMYLAAASNLSKSGRLESFELNDYAHVARASAAIVSDRASVHQDEFENFFRYIDPESDIDLCFLDSKHDSDTILRNYKSVLGWLSPGGVLMIDDVMSTPASRSAWNRILRRGDFAFTACIHNRIGFLAR